MRRPVRGHPVPNGPLARKLFLGRNICTPWRVLVSTLGKVSALRRRCRRRSGDFLRINGRTRKLERLNQRRCAVRAQNPHDHGRIWPCGPRGQNLASVWAPQGQRNQRPGRRAGDDAALRASSSNYPGLGVHIANGGIKRKVRLASRITLEVSAIGKVCASSRRSGLAAGRTGCAGWLGRPVYWRAAKPSRKTVVMSSASWLVG
jgi:hypothetical protein